MPTQDLKGDTYRVLRQLAEVPPLGATGFPYLLRAYTGELHCRYNVPQSDLVLACLAAAGAAAGSRAKVDIGWGARPVGPNLLLILKPESSTNLLAAVEHIVAPLVARQNDLLRQRGETTVLKLEKEIEFRRQEMRNARIRESDGPKYLKEIGTMLRVIKPVLLIGRLDREALLRALSQSMDGTLFLCNESARQEGGFTMETDQSLDAELLLRCVSRFPIDESLGRVKAQIGEPSLGGVLIAPPLSFASLFGQCGGSPALGGGLLLLRSPAKAGLITTAIMERFTSQEDWRLQMEYLMNTWNPDANPLHKTNGARAKLFGFYNGVLEMLPQLPAGAQNIVAASYNLATRFMVGLHLMDCRSPVITEETAVTAMKLARHYSARQICAWLDAHADGMTGHDFQGQLKVVRLEAA